MERNGQFLYVCFLSLLRSLGFSLGCSLSVSLSSVSLFLSVCPSEVSEPISDCDSVCSCDLFLHLHLCSHVSLPGGFFSLPDSVFASLVSMSHPRMWLHPKPKSGRRAGGSLLWSVWESPAGISEGRSPCRGGKLLALSGDCGEGEAAVPRVARAFWNQAAVLAPDGEAALPPAGSHDGQPLFCPPPSRAVTASSLPWAMLCRGAL